MTKATVFDQYKYFSEKGPFFEDIDALPLQPPSQAPVRYVAYYLPQFHTIPENDRWWGTGFTEWTNVTRALPRYAGHYQPRRPADLGFYDLANPEVLHRQGELARRGGIAGFCIHDYWFSGAKLLGGPLQTLLQNSDLEIPFCLNWANENWSRRWDGKENEVLMQQRYEAESGAAYAASILPALQDRRYITIAGRPLVMIYRPSVIPEARRAMDDIRNFLTGEGLAEPYLVMPQVFDQRDPREFGMDAAAGFPPHGSGLRVPVERGKLKLFDPKFNGFVFKYDTLAERIGKKAASGYKLFPGVCPSWDNEARRGRDGTSYYGSTPDKYGTWLRAASEEALALNQGDERIVFINAWNEWAEGAYLEPDRHFGFAYLAETRRVLDDLAVGGTARRPWSGKAAELAFEVEGSFWNYVPNAFNIASGMVAKLASGVADRLRRRP